MTVTIDRRHEPEVEVLHRIIARQKATIARLSINEAFGCMTRQALDIFLEDFDLSGTMAVFWDVDQLKQANARWGKVESSQRIKEAIRARGTDITAGQVFSGDEFIAFPPEGDAVDMAWRIQQEFNSRDMSATFVIALPRPGETASALLARVDSVCNTRKGQGYRGTIHITS